jgi:hypothetical protein
MANISSYPSATPGSSDLVPFTKNLKNSSGEEVTVTRNCSVSQIAGFANVTAAYTVYTALVTQASTNAPTAKILQNTTGATLTWARTGSGTYTITASGNAFTSNKTLVFYNLGEYAFSIGQPWTRTSDTVITISLGGDGRITNGAFEVRIYT